MKLLQSHTQQLADQILLQIEAEKLETLPSMAALAKLYSCDIRRLSLAMHLLRKKGIVNIEPGKRMTISSQIVGMEIGQKVNQKKIASISLPIPILAHERFANTLSKRILKGEYSIGKPLPKLKFFTLKNEISDHTVIQGFRYLERQGFVHQRGKKWIVGSALPAQISRNSEIPFWSRSPNKTIVLLQPNNWYWVGLMTPRTLRYYVRFTAEAENHSVRLLPCIMEADKPTLSYSPAGKTEVLHLIDSLGETYLGTLILGASAYWQSQISFLRQLLGRQKPLLWFDQSPSDSTLLSDKHFFRFHCSEQSMAKAAAQALIHAGHRVWGYADFESEAWSDRRYNLLCQYLPAKDGYRIFRTKDLWAKWLQKSIDQRAKELKNLHKKGGNDGALAKKLISYLLAQLILYKNVLPLDQKALNPYNQLADFFTAWQNFNVEAARPLWYFIILTPLFLEDDIDVIILPRDSNCGKVYGAMQRLGLHIPNDISLLSFDNRPEEAMGPLSSVDMGMEELGFTSFHTLLGDLPLSRSHEYCAEARLIDRGTLKIKPRSLPEGLLQRP